MDTAFPVLRSETTPVRQEELLVCAPLSHAGTAVCTSPQLPERFEERYNRGVIHELRCWLVLTWWWVRYFLYRVGIGECPILSSSYREAMIVVGRCCGWLHRIEIVGAENCPNHGPAAFASNHLKGDDPLAFYRAIYLGSERNIFPRLIGRDDVVYNGPFSGLIDLNEVLALCGGIVFSRDNVKMAQLKPVIQSFCDGDCFALFPGRTRSRTGVIFEYPNGSDGPGGLSLFVAHAQRKQPGLRIPLISVARTFHPVSKQTIFVIGEPQYLPSDAGRTTRNDMDRLVVERIAAVSAVNVPQILCAILCDRSIHNRLGPVAVTALEAAVREIVNGITGRYVDPAAKTDLEHEVKAMLKYLRRAGMVHVRRGMVTLNAEAVRHTPEPDFAFRDKNPIQYLTNQILHCTNVLQAVERVSPNLGP